MELVIEITFEEQKGTATSVASGTMGCFWQIEIAGKHLLTIREDYHGVPHYSVFNHSEEITKEKAIDQSKIILYQIRKSIMDNRRKPPKRYR